MQESLICIGESGHGKSTFINTVAEEKFAKTNSSLSETTLPKRYVPTRGIFKSVNLIDTPGFKDTNGVSDHKIYDHIQNFLNSIYLNDEKKKSVYFIAFQSVTESRYRIKLLISNLIATYGTSVLNSTVILLTKTDLIDNDEEDLLEAKESIKDDLKEISYAARYIPLIEWSKKQRKNEKARLAKALKGIQPYTTASLRKMQNEMEAEATKRYNAAPKTRQVLRHRSVRRCRVRYVLEKYQERAYYKSIRKELIEWTEPIHKTYTDYVFFIFPQTRTETEYQKKQKWVDKVEYLPYIQNKTREVPNHEYYYENEPYYYSQHLSKNELQKLKSQCTEEVKKEFRKKYLYLN
jgi:GTP-binding protein EngB required for normal cell division